MFATPVGNPTMNIGVAQIRGALIKIYIQKIFLSLPDAAFNIYIYGIWFRSDSLHRECSIEQK